MTLEEQRRLDEIAKQFAKDYEANPNMFVEAYLKEFKNYLCNDNALELCKEYKNGDNTERMKLADKLGETAGKMIAAAYERMLKEEPQQRQFNAVLFVCGGPGAGKTSTIKSDREVQNMRDSTHIVYEVVMGLNDERMNKAWNAGKDVGVLFVHRPVEQAAPSTLERAVKEGRLTTFDYVTKGHFVAQQKLFEAVEKYEENPRFGYLIYDNGLDGQPARMADLEFLRENAYKDIEEVRDRASIGVENECRKRASEGRGFSQELGREFYRDEAPEYQRMAEERWGNWSQQLEQSDRGREQGEEAETRRDNEQQKTELADRQNPIEIDRQEAINSAESLFVKIDIGNDQARLLEITGVRDERQLDRVTLDRELFDKIAAHPADVPYKISAEELLKENWRSEQKKQLQGITC
jgi:hypothetical protein